MKIRLALTLSFGKKRKEADDDITVDLVGHLRDVPTATYDNGFLPNDDDRRMR